MTPPTPLQQMSPGMAAIFTRLQQEDAHLPNPMEVPWEQAQSNFHHTSSRWNRVDFGVVQIDYFSVPCPTRQMPAVRLVRRVDARRGTLLYLHGGGWVFGSIQTHLGTMARLAELTGLTVIGIDYGMAPQAPFPGGLNDATRAWAWLRGNSADLKTVPVLADLTGPWLVSGDSAGANIALAMMLDLRDAGEPLPDAALLFYGVYSADHTTDSHQQCGGGQFGLSTEKMAWYRSLYLSGPHPNHPNHPNHQNPNNPRVSPALANLTGLPPIYMNAAGLDCLRDDSILLDQRLTDAGVTHEFKQVDGVNHGFMQMSNELPEAMVAFEDAAAFVETWLPRA